MSSFQPEKGLDAAGGLPMISCSLTAPISPPIMSTSARLIEVLKNVAETDEVERNLDLPLYDSQVLDSMKTVDLIVAISAEFGVDISPAEFEREKCAGADRYPSIPEPS